MLSLGEFMQPDTEIGNARPLLRGRLQPPRPPPTPIHRPALFDRLHAGVDRALTLISAPAGSGKTTLLSAWLTAQPRPWAWVGLDPYDSELTAFVRYLVAAMQTVDPGVGRATLGLLQLPQLPPVDYIATTLLDELAALPGACILAIDDYHLIKDPTAHALVSQLISGLPPTVRLLIATRSDPPLPLH